MASIDQNETEIPFLFSSPYGIRFSFSPGVEPEKYQTDKIDRLNCDKGLMHGIRYSIVLWKSRIRSYMYFSLINDAILNFKDGQKYNAG